jgi:multisubunit Na+/H+ antiporter MnhG subunit
MYVLKILAFILMAIGAFINYGARLIVNKMELAGKMDAKEAEELVGEELEKYKYTKALARVKTVGLIVLLAGVLIILGVYR